MKLIQSKRETELTQRRSQHLGSHAFRPNTRKVETGVIWLSRKRNIRWEETEPVQSEMQSEIQSEMQSEIAV